jgi:starch phosphorylase
MITQNLKNVQAAGAENFFLFGLNAREVENLYMSGYRAADYAAANPRLREIINALNVGFGGVSFAHIAQYLTAPQNGGLADPFLCLADFDSYCRVHGDAVSLYRNNPLAWGRASVHNIAAAGFFAADRSIDDYAKNIWHLNRVTD